MQVFRLAVNLKLTLHPVFFSSLLVFVSTANIPHNVPEVTFISFISNTDESKQLNF